jgi:Family of unknown function (DUF5719)
MTERSGASIARGLARGLSGIVAIGVAVVTIFASAVLPIPTLRDAPPSLSIQPVSASPLLACPGSFLRLGDEQGKNVTSPHGVGDPTSAVGASAGTPLITRLSLEGADGPLTGPPTVLSAPTSADGKAAPALAGASAQLVDSGDLRGLAAAQCGRASTDNWLVGGATTIGRTTLITVANPSDVVATVAIEIFGENGRVDAPGSTGILVSAQSQRVLSLAAFAPDLSAPAVHVTSQGSPVAVFLQQSIVRGIESGGIDVVGESMAPSRRQVIPAIVLVNGAELESQLGKKGYTDLGAVLRIFVPGTANGTAQIAISSGAAGSPGGSFTIDLTAGQVTEIPLEELADGVYSIAVTATVPVVAAARLSTIVSASSTDLTSTPGPIDFAWFGAAEPLAKNAFFTVAPLASLGDAPELHLSNPTSAVIKVSLRAVGGQSSSLSIGPDSTESVPVAPGVSYRLSGFSSLYASVTIAGSGSLASYLVSPTAGQLGSLTVYP